DVLRAVRSATGAAIDIPGVASERVNVNLGPGRPRAILASLLNGSRYDYMLLDSQQPDSIARIILSIRRDPSDPPTTSNASDAGEQPDAGEQIETPKQSVRDMKQIMEQQ